MESQGNLTRPQREHLLLLGGAHAIHLVGGEEIHVDAAAGEGSAQRDAKFVVNFQTLPLTLDMRGFGESGGTPPDR